MSDTDDVRNFIHQIFSMTEILSKQNRATFTSDFLHESLLLLLFKGPIRLQECEILSFHWIRETVRIKVTTERSNFHVNISEQFTIRECMRPSLERSVNMDL